MSLPVRRVASSRARLPVSGLVRGVSHRPASSASKAMANEKQHVSFKDMVYGNPLGLPRLPIPELKDTVSRYLQVCSSESCLGVLELAAGNLQVQSANSTGDGAGLCIGFLDERNTRRHCSGTINTTAAVPRIAGLVGFAPCCCRSSEGSRHRLSFRQGGRRERTTAFIGCW